MDAIVCSINVSTPFNLKDEEVQMLTNAESLNLADLNTKIFRAAQSKIVLSGKLDAVEHFANEAKTNLEHLCHLAAKTAKLNFCLRSMINYRDKNPTNATQTVTNVGGSSKGEICVSSKGETSEGVISEDFRPGILGWERRLGHGPELA
jgi:hypothetical protein